MLTPEPTLSATLRIIDWLPVMSAWSMASLRYKAIPKSCGNRIKPMLLATNSFVMPSSRSLTRGLPFE